MKRVISNSQHALQVNPTGRQILQILDFVRTKEEAKDLEEKESAYRRTELGLHINVGKTKVMETGNEHHTINIMFVGKEIQLVEHFCYLGSMETQHDNSSKYIKNRTGKACSTIGALNIRSNKNLKQTKDKAISI